MTLLSISSNEWKLVPGKDDTPYHLEKRLIDILNPTGQTIDALKTLTLPAGVDIKIKA